MEKGWPTPQPHRKKVVHWGNGNRVDGSEMGQAPVKVHSLSHYLCAVELYIYVGCQLDFFLKSNVYWIYWKLTDWTSEHCYLFGEWKVLWACKASILREQFAVWNLWMTWLNEYVFYYGELFGASEIVQEKKYWETDVLLSPTNEVGYMINELDVYSNE